MKIKTKISDFDYEKEYGVIINCGTRLSTTLAILSALRYLNMPLLVVDCKLPTANEDDLDFDYLKKLQKTNDFMLISLPLRKHGETLDNIFTQLNTEYICLIDSDVEILNADAIKYMRLHSRQEKVFGTGFTHGPHNKPKGLRNGYYAERMYIPFTFLSVAYCKQAIKAGVSFNIVKVWNDFPCHTKSSQLIYKYLTKYKFFDSIINLFRKNYDGYKPSVILQDTGANVYKYLKNKGLYFIGFPRYAENLYIIHFDGITRNTLNGDTLGTKLNSVEMVIKQRLMALYGFDFDNF